MFHGGDREIVKPFHEEAAGLHRRNGLNRSANLAGDGDHGDDPDGQAQDRGCIRPAGWK